jgi:bacterioferritin-associated ferredoxin
MKSFKELTIAHHHKLPFPSVEVTLKKTGHQLYLQFDSKDNLKEASYSGAIDPWISALCEMITGKSLNSLLKLSWNDWDDYFKADQAYWDLKSEMQEDIIFPAQELLRAALDTYRGRDYLYLEADPLVCRCFGVREKDILKYIKDSEDPTVEGLASATKAGMGCRSCLPQLKRWLFTKSEPHKHYYKSLSRSEWVERIDGALKTFPHALEWRMEIKQFKGNQVIISFQKESVGQKVEEEMGIELQEFLASSVDSDLGFFLIKR